MYLVYKTDNQHSYASRDVIGVVNNPTNAIGVCIKQADKEGEQLTSDQIFNLRELKQTQGYSGNGELMYEQVKLNTLL